MKTMNKKTIITALFALVAMTGQGQTGRDYWIAADKALVAGNTDSTLYYLNLFREHFGRQYAFAYTTFLTEEDYRTLHNDARWTAFMDSMRVYKHEAEDKREISYPRKAVVEDTNAPTVKRYDILLDIDVEKKTLAVTLTAQIDFKGSKSIDFTLWKYSDIKHIRSKNKELAYSFDTKAKSSNTYIRQGAPLRLTVPKKKGVCSITFDYTCNLDSLDTWMSSMEKDWVQLGYYVAWFPVNSDSRDFTANVSVSINDGYTVSGSGIVEHKDNKWEMLQPWGGFDLQIVASPTLKSKKMTNDGRTFEVVYTDFADADADSALLACSEALQFYTRLFKTNPSNDYMKFLVVPRRGGGISRKNFIAYATKRFNEHFKTAIGHEMGHFWWNKAPTFSWEDWLNEGFAEFSMLWYIKCHFSKHIFDCYLEACCENARHACPIYEVDRDSPEAYDALYNKGALLLYDLSQEVGEEKFFGFIQGVAEREISSTEQLLKYAEDTLGHDVKEWIEDRIKS
jgi:hypothetical protein